MDHGHWIFTDWINRNAFIEGYKMKMVGIYIYIGNRGALGDELERSTISIGTVTLHRYAINNWSRSRYHQIRSSRPFCSRL